MVAGHAPLLHHLHPPPPRSVAICNAAVIADGSLPAAPIIWAVGTSALLCTTFYVFEQSVETARDKIPAYIRPTIDCLLAEMATLGFIGLLVQADVFGLEKGAFSELSEQYLGESALGYELFEGVHQTLFRCAIAYFLSCGAVVASVTRQLGMRFEKIDSDADGIITLNEFKESEDALYSRYGDLGLRKALRDRVTVTNDVVQEVRSRGGLTKSGLESFTADVLEELVEVDPLTIFLITTPIELPALVLQLTTDQPLLAAPGEYLEYELPFFGAVSAVILSLSYGLFLSPEALDAGEELRGESFVIDAVKVLTFAASYILVAGSAQVSQDLFAVLGGAATTPIVSELAAVSACLVAMVTVLARQSSVLFEFINAAGLARLKASPNAEYEI